MRIRIEYYAEPFQLTAARRRLVFKTDTPKRVIVFQLTAARRRLDLFLHLHLLHHPFQLTAARRRLGSKSSVLCSRIGFNSQPPEGGWLHTARNTGV